MIAEIAIGAKAAAFLASTRRRELRAVAYLLGFGLAADVARLALQKAFLAPARAAGALPYAGHTLGAFRAEQALFLAWPFGVASVAWWSWRRELLGQPVAWLLCCASFGAAYPSLRGASLGTAYAIVAGGCVAWSLLGVGLRRERAGLAQLVALLLVAGECATLIGPYLGDPFAGWALGQMTWAGVFTLIALAGMVKPWMNTA